MAEMTLTIAQTITKTALEKARELKLNVLAVAVLDARGALVAYAAEDGSSLARSDIAIGKARGALNFGMGTRSLFKRSKDNPAFVISAAMMMSGGLIPVPGGVLVRDADNRVIGAVGVSGDTSDNDEIAAMAGIAAAGLRGDGGSD